ncbi:Mismatch repair endonuclease PMS2 [Orchesella cincta]|uniref:Mismatch repair endonuclease PMS2 n=1 Tax=Orchesella cincta TaxID=48709 RepID=A0A1D2NH82_ORCCI|nr:Mismatch repair endonuclease PMS2 [Orchesella cincta]
MDDDRQNEGPKSAKISILKHLQAFRASGSALSSTSTPKIAARKIQDVILSPSESESSKTTEVEMKDVSVPHNSCDADNMEEEECFDKQKEAESVQTILENREESDDGRLIHKLEEGEEKQRANIIRPIDRGVVHQICSGQVIVTLSTAVKELVENSIDAGATKIDIRLVECGSKLIEISDNGSGIEESNFEGLALKHHTSKITEFEDLGSISTFGFRGEALSSLCALSNLTVITRHKDNDQKVGHKIEYAHGGTIASRTRCARECGTTVILKDLFYTLPVRHREFIKNLKREFHRMVNVLYGYCLVVNGVRISCSNVVGNGRPSEVIAVPGFSTMRERIVAVFGSKQLSSLIEIKQTDAVPSEILSEFGLPEEAYERKYELEGYISQPNQGRSSNDRQFFFINSRPCDPAKISRVINEVYHSFSRSQNPFVCLHIRTNRENVDINVTPDKRTLYVQNEKILLAILKATLIPIFTAAASSYHSLSSQSSQLTFSGNSQSFSEEAISSSPSELSVTFGEPECLSESSKMGFAPQYSTSRGKGLPPSVVAKTNSFLKSLASKSSSSRSGMKKLSDFSTSVKRCREATENDQDEDDEKHRKLSRHVGKYEVGEKQRMGSKFDANKAVQQREGSSEEQDSDFEILEFDDSEEEEEKTCIQVKPLDQPIDDDDDDDDDMVKIVYDDDDEFMDEDVSQFVKQKSISVDWKSIFTKLTSLKLRNENSSSSINYARRFRAKIAPEDNSTAEEELKKQLSKDMFSRMEIIGQFNLGFVIVKNGPDLFIVDQHASDEKFNFEDLQRNFTLQGQVLIRPLDLQLPAISENIIIDNVHLFQKNGFDFIISPDEEPTKRVKLSKIPYSKNTEFGKSDIEELIFMMEDASDKVLFRPSKVRDLLASRACRKSVMIGTALNLKEMRGIVDHMGEMDQPWNCPHGRPTIRHLINVNLLPDVDYTKFNH